MKHVMKREGKMRIRDAKNQPILNAVEDALLLRVLAFMMRSSISIPASGKKALNATNKGAILKLKNPPQEVISHE